MEPHISGLEVTFRLLAVLFLVAANGFFVAAEFSLVTVRRTRIDQLVAEGKPFARAVRRALQDLDAYIAATQLGITMASIGLGWVGEPALAALLEPAFHWVPEGARFISIHAAAVTLAFAIITALHIVLGELAPKTIAIQRAEKTALIVSVPIHGFLLLFKPFILALNGVGMLVLRIFGFKGIVSGHHVAHSEEELKMIVSASTEAGVLAPEEEDMIHRVFEFADLMAYEIMVPRTEVMGLPVGASRDELARILREHAFTRYPVYDGSLDNIVGVANVKDLLPALEIGETLDLRRVMRPPLVLPESIRLFRLLAAMQGDRRHLVVLIDEFGGTAGIVTLRDVMERIVGDVRSEKEAGWADVECVAEHEALVDGLMLVQDVNERFELELDDEEYTTIGGYAFGALGRRPEIGDAIDIPGGRLVVEGLDGMRVSRLRLVLEKPVPAPEGLLSND